MTSIVLVNKDIKIYIPNLDNTNEDVKPKREEAR